MSLGDRHCGLVKLVKLRARPGWGSPALFPVTGPLGLVGFDAADIVGCTLLQRGHQVVGLFLRRGRRWGVGEQMGPSGPFLLPPWIQT